MSNSSKTYGKSYRSIGRGGQKFWDEMREASLGTVYVLTDDTEITLGHYLGISRGGYYKIVYCTGQDRRTRRMNYEAVTIDPDRVVEWRDLG